LLTFLHCSTNLSMEADAAAVMVMPFPEPA
jgi:hypothetical protein